VVARVFDRIFTVLYGFLRTPLQASVALLALVVPDGFAITKSDVLCRADFGADAAFIAFFIGAKTAIHLCQIGCRQMIYGCEDNSLPERAFFH